MNPENEKSTENAGPDWDMSAYFPEFGGPDYQAFRERLASDIADLQEVVTTLAPIDEAPEAWASFAERLEDLFARHRHLGSYLGCLQAADANDREVERHAAALSVSRADLEKIFVPFRASLAELDDAAFGRWVDRPDLAPVAYFLDRARRRARQSMSGSMEELAAELGVTGLSAWGRLYDRISGTLEFDLVVPGQAPKRLPVSQARSLMGDTDAEVRRAALIGLQPGLGECRRHHGGVPERHFRHSSHPLPPTGRRAFSGACPLRFGPLSTHPRDHVRGRPTTSRSAPRLSSREG